MERVLALRSSISPSSRGLSPNLLMALMTSYLPWRGPSRNMKF